MYSNEKRKNWQKESETHTHACTRTHTYTLTNTWIPYSSVGQSQSWWDSQCHRIRFSALLLLSGLRSDFCLKPYEVQPLLKKKKKKPSHPKPATQAPAIHSRFSSINFKSKHVNIGTKFSDVAGVSNFSGSVKNEIAPRLHLN